jgi:hypothetical protein
MTKKGVTRKKNTLQCNGISNTKKQCFHYVECDNCEDGKCNCGLNQTYCNLHKYFEKFTADQIKKIKKGDAVNCSGCKLWDLTITSGPRCDKCIKLAKEARKKKKADRIECDALLENGKKCTYEALEDTKFCKRHSKNNNTNTIDDANDLKFCSGCKKMLSDEHFDENVRCITCNERSKKNNEKKKKDRNNLQKCKKCNDQALKNKKYDSNKILNNTKLTQVYDDYCGKHQLDAWKDEVSAMDQKVCQGLNHYGCREILELDDKARCRDCLDKDNKKEQNTRDKKSSGDKYVQKDNTKYKVCSTCPDSTGVWPVDDFIENGHEYSTCIKCRIKTREQDKKRVNRKRNWKEELEKNPERKAKKELWKKQNKEKIEEYYKLSRAKRKEKLGYDEYLKLMAKQAKEWRKRNPEALKKIQEKSRRNCERRIWIYKRSARERGLEFELTDEQCIEFFKSKCALCDGENPDELLCGIDRIDNGKDYIYKNCQACCTMCNMIKGTITDECLMRKVEHILNCVGIIETNDGYYFEEFNNHIYINYSDYTKRSNKKKINFELTFEEFTIITSDDCYLCGKSTDRNHINGIDQIKSKGGYYFGNIMPCCADCNYMKNKYNLVDYVYKLYEMYIISKGLAMNLTKNDITDIVNEYIKEKNDELKYFVNKVQEINNDNDDNDSISDDNDSISDDNDNISDDNDDNDSISDDSISDDNIHIALERLKNKKQILNSKKQNEHAKNNREKQKKIYGDERNKAIQALVKKIQRHKKDGKGVDDLEDELVDLRNTDNTYKKHEMTDKEIEQKKEKIKEQSRLRLQKFRQKNKK